MTGLHDENEFNAAPSRLHRRVRHDDDGLPSVTAQGPGSASHESAETPMALRWVMTFDYLLIGEAPMKTVIEYETYEATSPL
jgi:hypothetical protein